MTRKNDLIIMLFNKLLKHDKNMKEYISALSENLIKSVIKSANVRVKSDELTKLYYERVLPHK